MTLSSELSQACFLRDKFRCRHCRSRNGLQPHHVIYKSHQGPDALNNLLTLCAVCHRGHHDGFLEITVLEKLKTDLIVHFTRKKNWKPNGT